jgi:lipopolysaccharide biosynthesis glycosyltransferase
MNCACVFSIDDAYVMPFQVFYHSLEATDSIPGSIHLFILHTETLSSESIKELQAFLCRYGRSATFLDASPLIPADLPLRSGDHVSPATFYRLFIAEILPPEFDQAVYLDADMLALRSIAPLFSEPVSGLVAAADHCTPANEVRLWGECGGSYFQAGVLSIPLKKWREQGLLQSSLQVMASNHHRILLWDQDVLNIALRDQWQRIPIWYNVHAALSHSFSQAELEKHACVIHFTGRHKPWNALDSSPFTAQWDAAYADAFGVPFDRSAFQPSSRSRLKHAVLSRFSGLIHGRQS